MIFFGQFNHLHEKMKMKVLPKNHSLGIVSNYIQIFSCSKRVYNVTEIKHEKVQKNTKKYQKVQKSTNKY